MNEQEEQAQLLDKDPVRSAASWMSELNRSGLYWRVWAHLSSELVCLWRDNSMEHRAHSANQTAKALGASQSAVARAYRQLIADGILYQQGSVKGTRYCHWSFGAPFKTSAPPRGYVEEVRRDDPFPLDQQEWDSTDLGAAAR